MKEDIKEFADFGNVDTDNIIVDIDYGYYDDNNVKSIRIPELDKKIEDYFYKQPNANEPVLNDLRSRGFITTGLRPEEAARDYLKALGKIRSDHQILFGSKRSAVSQFPKKPAPRVTPASSARGSYAGIVLRNAQGDSLIERNNGRDKGTYLVFKVLPKK